MKQDEVKAIREFHQSLIKLYGTSCITDEQAEKFRAELDLCLKDNKPDLHRELEAITGVSSH